MAVLASATADLDAGRQTSALIESLTRLADDTNAPAAPLLVDVQAFCLRHRLLVRPAAPVRKELDIYRSARHRRLSQGLHRLCYLGVPYAQRLAGPDFVAGTGLARVREVWTLGWQVETTVALTEAMCHGSSLEEAAVHLVRERLVARLARLLGEQRHELVGAVDDRVAVVKPRQHRDVVPAGQADIGQRERLAHDAARTRQRPQPQPQISVVNESRSGFLRYVDSSAYRLTCVNTNRL